jgi:hypothetical protein
MRTDNSRAFSPIERAWHKADQARANRQQTNREYRPHPTPDTTNPHSQAFAAQHAIRAR